MLINTYLRDNVVIILTKILVNVPIKDLCCILPRKMAEVVNVKVKYIRPTYKDLKEWCEDENNVYIGRAGPVFVQVGDKKERYPKKASIWCNPYKVTAEMPLDKSLKLYRKHLRKMLEDDETLKEFLLLEGKTLGCWCKTESLTTDRYQCHGDVIVDELNKRLRS